MEILQIFTSQKSVDKESTHLSRSHSELGRVQARCEIGDVEDHFRAAMPKLRMKITYLKRVGIDEVPSLSGNI